MDSNLKINGHAAEALAPPTSTVNDHEQYPIALRRATGNQEELQENGNPASSMHASPRGNRECSCEFRRWRYGRL
jgi:hypothetical protein